MLYKIVTSLSFMLFKILFRLEQEGAENIPDTGAFILASNHTSYLDPVVMAVCCPRQLNFLTRHDLFSIPIFGAFIRNCGAFPVRRGFTDITSIKEALRHLHRGSGLLIFPEGGRSFEELIKKAEPGIGFIAVKSGAPIIPAFVKGARRAFGRNARFIRPGKIKVYFGKPIYPTSNSLKEDYGHLATRIMQEINRLSHEEGGRLK